VQASLTCAHTRAHAAGTGTFGPFGPFGPWSSEGSALTWSFGKGLNYRGTRRHSVPRSGPWPRSGFRAGDVPDNHSGRARHHYSVVRPTGSAAPVDSPRPGVAPQPASGPHPLHDAEEFIGVRPIVRTAGSLLNSPSTVSTLTRPGAPLALLPPPTDPASSWWMPPATEATMLHALCGRPREINPSWFPRRPRERPPPRCGRPPSTRGLDAFGATARRQFRPSRSGGGSVGRERRAASGACRRPRPAAPRRQARW
jgi:hypothetical protein